MAKASPQPIHIHMDIQPYRENRKTLSSDFQEEFQNFLKYKQNYNKPLSEAQKTKLQQKIKAYLDAYDKAIQIYENMDLNSLFQHLPLTKQGYLPKNRKICIWDSQVGNPFPNVYTKGETLQIILEACDTPLDFNNPHSIFDYEKVNTEGVIHIDEAPKPKTVSPVLDDNGCPQPITINRATYLKPKDIHPGGIYKQKTGKDLLYLGRFIITDKTYDGKPIDWRSVVWDCHVYIYVTKDVETLLQTCSDVPTFLNAYNQLCLTKKQVLEDKLHMVKNLKKVTQQISQPLKPLKSTFDFHYDIVDSYKKTVVHHGYSTYEPVPTESEQ